MTDLERYKEAFSNSKNTEVNETRFEEKQKYKLFMGYEDGFFGKNKYAELEYDTILVPRDSRSWYKATVKFLFNDGELIAIVPIIL